MLMIITCPVCKKKFDLNENLIPDAGRLLKCGSCGETWLFNKKDPIKTEINLDKTSSVKKKETKDYNPLEEKKEIKKNVPNFSNKKGSELVKYKSKSSFTIIKLLSYLVVTIISFIALVIVMDTLKEPLSIFFPNIELVLFNLFETIKDIFLFAKDLS